MKNKYNITDKELDEALFEMTIEENIERISEMLETETNEDSIVMLKERLSKLYTLLKT